jgi:hypothetical protein
VVRRRREEAADLVGHFNQVMNIHRK